MGRCVAIPARRLSETEEGLLPCMTHLHWLMTSALAAIKSWTRRLSMNRHEERIRNDVTAAMRGQITSAHLREPAYAAWCRGVQPSLFLDLITAARMSASSKLKQSFIKHATVAAQTNGTRADVSDTLFTCVARND
jgi:hypothetical protein